MDAYSVKVAVIMLELLLVLGHVLLLMFGA